MMEMAADVLLAKHWATQYVISVFVVVACSRETWIK